MLIPCGANPLKDPLAVAAPVAPPMLAVRLSEKPSLAAVFVSDQRLRAEGASHGGSFPRLTRVVVTLAAA